MFRKYDSNRERLAERSANAFPLGNRLAECSANAFPLGNRLAERSANAFPLGNRLAECSANTFPLGNRLAEKYAKRAKKETHLSVISRVCFYYVITFISFIQVYFSKAECFSLGNKRALRDC